ncbi:MAG: hypothetical protein FWD92_05890 [Methanomassiliicoccaceae archaeon]|nr:hypothetical protein [Methanomassiliicoccaceae archaeon]
MTSEILIMNKNCIVLAADSASTVRKEEGPKIFSADKIFALSRKHPVGVMTYNHSEISGMPIEIIIKEFRVSLGNASFPTLREYAESFFRFINTGNALENGQKAVSMISDDLADMEMSRMIVDFWKEICKHARERFDSVRNDLIKNSSVDRKKLEEVSKDSMKEVVENMLGKCTVDFKSKAVRSVREKILENLDRGTVFILDEDAEQFSIMDHLDPVVRIFTDRIITLNGMGNHFSGLIFTGFGNDQIFPSFIEYKVYGSLFGELRYKEVKNGAISAKDPSWVEPFAQGDVTETFLTGVNERLAAYVLKSFNTALDDVTETLIDCLGGDDTHKESIRKYNTDLISVLVKDLYDFLEAKYMRPTKAIIKYLSKDELALMAESLVNITSLKRRISDGAETVGGPVDVAVISRGEGFIWIKRKQYFKAELNPHYLETHKE